MHPLTTCKTSDTITILETLFNKLVPTAKDGTRSFNRSQLKRLAKLGLSLIHI